MTGGFASRPPTPPWPGGLRPRGVACGLALALSVVAQAHEAPTAAIPDFPGLRVDAAVALGAFDAGSAASWPAARIPGWLGQGQGVDDRRGGSLEHASLGAGYRLDERWGARLAGGVHPGGRRHLETALLAWRTVDDAAERSEWSAQLGRRGVPLGAVVDAAGSFDAFAQTPLAKRLMLNEDWIDDGLLAAWQREPDAERPGLTRVGLGLWRARFYPGGRAGPPAITLGAGGNVGELDWDLGLAQLRPRERGVPIVSTGTGHTHTLPDCRDSTAALVCYRGTSRLVAAGALWAPHDTPWRVQGAVLGLEERGRLASPSGDVDYRGHHWGGWLEGRLQVAPAWATSLRLERVQTRHALEGTNAGLIAGEAGLMPNRPAERVALAASWAWRPELECSVEIGQERTAAPSALRWIGLRLVWRQELARWAR